MPTNKKKSKGKKRFVKTEAPPSMDQLLEAADAANHSDPCQALSILATAESLARDTTSQLAVLEKRAPIKVAVGDQDGALADYRAALALVSSQLNTAETPDLLEHKAGLYLYIGQLSEGSEALEVYRQGLDCLRQALAMREETASTPATTIVDDDDKDPQTLLLDTRRQLAAAYCSTAELYLTDLCFEPNAETECQSLIDPSLALLDADGKPFVDALQTAASLRLSQQRNSDAADFVLQAFGRIRNGCEALATLVGLREAAAEDEARELTELEAVQSLPGFEFRCQTAKLLLECAAVVDKTDERANQCTQAAIDVLGSLLAENDEVVEIWLLTGQAFSMMQPVNKSLAGHYWERAKEMLTSVQSALEQEIVDADDEDEEEDLQRQLDEVTCQLEDVATKLEGLEKEPEAMEE